MILLLELARGLAALWVFFFHVKPLFETSSPFIYSLSSFGSLGVPMFFVISGYVITFSAESNLKNKKSPFVFLKARFLRIYPAFWGSVLVVFATPYIIELISFLKTGYYLLPENLLVKLSYIEWSNFLMLSKVFWATSHNLQTEFNTINSVYWTLAIEFQFYLVVFTALCFKKYYIHIITFVSIASLLAMFAPEGINYGLFIHYWPSFSVGVVLAYFHRNKVWANLLLTNRVTQIIAVLATTGLLLSSVVLSDHRIVFAVSFGVFLWVISDIEKLMDRIKKSEKKYLFWLLEPWLILGTMSYSVYLLHGKIYQLPEMFVRQFLDSSNVFYGLLTILFTLLLCYPFYFYIEKKFLSKNYKLLQQKVVTKSTTEK